MALWSYKGVRNLLLATAGIAGLASAAVPEPPLIQAIKAGDLAAARDALADPNAAAPDGTTALHWAARAGDVNAAQMLLGAGADPNAANRYGATPLFLAVTETSLPVVEALLKAGADPNLALPEGETPLLTAARTGDPKIIQALIGSGADIEAREGFYGETPLIWAVAANHAEAVRTLLDAGADVNVRSTRTSFARKNAGLSQLPQGDWTPLMYAARDGARESAEVLLEHGADLNLVDPDGTTALVYAIINYHYDLAALLLDHGADPNVADSTGMNALFAAVDIKTLPWTFGRPEHEVAAGLTMTPRMLMEKLLDAGADPNARLTGVLLKRAHTDGDPAVGVGGTAYMRAAKAVDLETMKLLVERGADPNLKLDNGNTALMLAAGLGYRDGNMAVPTRDQGTEEEAIAAVQFCLDHGADINAVGFRGDTPLHLAVTGRGSLEVVEYLIDHGADWLARNERGQTPLDAALASRRDRSDVAAYLHQVMGE